MKRSTVFAGVLALSLTLWACSGAAPSPVRETQTAVTLSAASQRTETPFSDVPANAWYAAAVEYVNANGIMTGTEKGFEPESSFTRAQVATVFYRMAGEPAVTEKDAFTDTQSGQWYSSAVNWANDTGLVQGYGNGLFGTADPVTQEQLVTILHRYAGTPTGTADASEADPWYQSAVSWAKSSGLIGDELGYSFAHSHVANRSQVAAILYRYLSESQPVAEGNKVPSSDIPNAETVANAASTVYFTSEVTPEGLMAVYDRLNWNPTGKVAVKVSTGEPPASNYLRSDLIGDLVRKVDGTIVECNTAYGGSRSSSAMHKQVAADHGFTAIADFDLMDEEGEVEWPVTGGTRLDRILVGSHAENYDDWLILSHYKGHAMAGFGGAIKNVGIGASSASGKVLVHTAGTKTSGSIWYSDQDAWLEALAEMVDGFVDHVGTDHIVYVNVMNRLSVDCDCDGHPAEPDIHDIGILASTDPVALDQACYDLVAKADGNASLMNRIDRQHGLHTLEHAQEVGLGSREYTLVNVD